jgi:hypothetical protein
MKAGSTTVSSGKLGLVTGFSASVNNGSFEGLAKTTSPETC